MRWENLTVESGEPARPGVPGESGEPEHGRAADAALFGVDAVTTRTFDTPKVQSNTHHKTAAKSPAHQRRTGQGSGVGVRGFQ